MALRMAAKRRKGKARGKPEGSGRTVKRKPSASKSQRPAGQPAEPPKPASPVDVVRAALDREIRKRFAGVEEQAEYGMRGWRVPRAHRVQAWRGTIDPNYLHIFLVERKQGITFHYWNPMDPASFGKHRVPLQRAGFNVMVGCLQYNRRGDFPVEALLPLFDEAAAMIEGER